MAGPAEVWSVDLVRAAPALAALDAALGLASDEERTAAHRLRDADTGRQRLALRVALRLLAERRTGRAMRGTSLLVTTTGKPELPGRPCHVSLAHVAGRGLVALADDPVGIDLEAMRVATVDPRRRQIIEAAAAVLCPAAPLPQADDAHRFLQAWTRLEAAAKCEGSGIGRWLGAIGALGPGQASGDHSDTAARLAALAGGVDVQDLTLGPDHLGALACAAPLPRPVEARELPCGEAELRRLLAAAPRPAPA